LSGSVGSAAPGVRVRLSYRPIRRVFSLTRDNHAGFRDVIRHLSEIWGGALNFIAVEDEAGSWSSRTHSYLDTADPDFVTLLGEDRQARLRRLRSARDLPAEATNLAPPELAAPFAPSHRDPLAGPLMVDLPSGDALPGYYAAAYGEVGSTPGRHSGLGYVGHFLSQWSPSDTSALAHGVAGIRGLNVGFLNDAALTLVPVASPDSLTELADFWNLRAALWPSDNGVGLLPLWDLAWSGPRFRTLVRRWMIARDETRHTIVITPSAHSEQARQVVHEVFLTEDQPSDDPGAGRLYGIKMSLAVREAELPAYPIRLTGFDTEQLALHLPGGLSTMIATPITTEGWCAVDVLNEPRLFLPRRESLGPLVHPQARSMGDGVAVRIRPSRDRSLELALPGDAQVIEALLTDANYSHERSDNGRKADQLLAALGGNLRDLVIRDACAMEVVRALAPHRDKRLIQADAAQLPAQTLSLGQLRDRLGHDRSVVRRAISSLVRARVLFAGLRVLCRSCGLAQWRVIDDAATEMRCSGCLDSIRFDALEPGIDDEVTWCYRMNEAFSSIVSQGTGATLLALARIAQEDPRTFRFGTGRLLREDDRELVEVDGIACRGSEVFVLEAKSSGTVESDEIQRTLEVARRVRATAIIATIGTWNEPSKARLAEARRSTGSSKLLAWDKAELFDNAALA